MKVPCSTLPSTGRSSRGAGRATCTCPSTTAPRRPGRLPPGGGGDGGPRGGALPGRAGADRPPGPRRCRPCAMGSSSVGCRPRRRDGSRPQERRAPPPVGSRSGRARLHRCGPKCNRPLHPPGVGFVNLAPRLKSDRPSHRCRTAPVQRSPSMIRSYLHRRRIRRNDGNLPPKQVPPPQPPQPRWPRP